MADHQTPYSEDSEGTPLLSEPGSENIQGSRRRPCEAKGPQVVYTLITCLAPLVAGFALGFSSPTITALKDEGLLSTADQRSWFASLVTLGGIFGGPLAGLIVDRIGRKMTIMCCCLPWIIGWGLIAGANGYVLLYMGRLLTGCGIGMCCLCVPLYIAEIASKDMRGLLGAAFQLSIVSGIFLVFCVGQLLTWRWLALSSSALTALLIITVLTLPETPRWLLGAKDRTRAVENLRRLRGENADIEEECTEIEENLQMVHQQAAFSIRELLKPSIYKPLLIGTTVLMLQQLGGVNVVVFYSQPIFQDAGFSADASLPSIILGLVGVVVTFLCCVIVDKVGRRVLLILSGGFMTVSTLTLGFYYYLTEVKGHTGLGWLSLASLLVYFGMFSLGWGPVPWLVMSEMFPTRIRGVACGFATCLNWICAFLTVYLFNDLKDLIHGYGVFWMFAVICFLGVVFVAIFLPETKGKSLEEIEHHFEGHILQYKNPVLSNDSYY